MCRLGQAKLLNKDSDSIQSLRVIICNRLLCWRDVMIVQELLMLAILSLIVLAMVLLLRNRVADHDYGGVEPFLLYTEGNPKSSLQSLPDREELLVQLPGRCSGRYS